MPPGESEVQLNFLKEFTTEGRMISTVLRRIFVAVVAVGILMYILSGFYLIKTSETGVLIRFGHVIHPAVSPGLHYRFPWPMDSVDILVTGEEKRFEAGFESAAETDMDKQYEQILLTDDQTLLYETFTVPYCITGDRNIVHLRVIVRYKISDPVKYLYGASAPVEIAMKSTNSILVDIISRMNVDTVLTTGRVLISQKAENELRRKLVELGTGISVVKVEIKSPRPPTSVADAFKDVINARQERITMEHNAEAYANRVIPEGKGQASRIVSDAGAYKKRRTSHAQGEADRFSLLAEKYSTQKHLTTDRLYLEALEEILPSIQKIVVQSDKDGDVVNLKLFSFDGEDTSFPPLPIVME